jgi:hypothetical protein
MDGLDRLSFLLDEVKRLDARLEMLESRTCICEQEPGSTATAAAATASAEAKASTTATTTSLPNRVVLDDIPGIERYCGTYYKAPDMRRHERNYVFKHEEQWVFVPQMGLMGWLTHDEVSCKRLVQKQGLTLAELGITDIAWNDMFANVVPLYYRVDGKSFIMYRDGFWHLVPSLHAWGWIAGRPRKFLMYWRRSLQPDAPSAKQWIK